jgi:hypothetical protein
MSDTPNGQAKIRSGADYENQLGVLAAKANKCHWKYHKGVKPLLPYAKAPGQALIAAKELAGRRNWLCWLEHDFDASADAAERYMAIARGWPEVERLLSTNPKATVGGALPRIHGRDPSVPRPTRTVVEVPPAEEARRNLGKKFNCDLSRLTDEQVLYLYRFGADMAGQVSECWLDECELAHCVMPLLLRFEEASARVDAKCAELRINEEQHRKALDRMETVFRRELAQRLPDCCEVLSLDRQRQLRGVLDLWPV